MIDSTARRYSTILFILLVSILTLITGTAWAETASEAEMEQVCRNWLTLVVDRAGSWAGSTAPDIAAVEPIVRDGELLGRCYTIDPDGFVIVPVLKEMSPIKAWSAEGRFNVDADGGIPVLMKDLISDRYRLYTEAYGSLEAVQPADGEVLLGRGHRESWNRYAVSPKMFVASSLATGSDEDEIVGPLLQTAWDQRLPYNRYCPTGSQGLCVVGCVATSYAQIMRYHKWPVEGDGSYSFVWDGDWSCDEYSPGGVLTADFSDPYDWDNMPLACAFGCTPEDTAAVAELCYEVGVALDMNYGSCASGAYPGQMTWMMPEHFGYSPDMTEIFRSNHTLSYWFNVIQEQIRDSLPAEYSIVSHSIVMDGFSTWGGMMQYHMNYGWSDGHTAWYILDSLHCPWEGCDPMYERMVINIRPDKAVVIDASERFGWVPFEVDFAGSSELSVDSWAWSFGDNDSAFTQNCAHTYQAPGYYDISLQINAGGDVRTRLKSDYILAIADSLVAPDMAALPGQQIEVVVSGRNLLPVNKIWIPVIYTGDLDLSYDSFSTVGCRTSYFEIQSLLHYSSSSKKVTVKLQASTTGTSPDLQPGLGPVLKLYFTIDVNSPMNHSTVIDLSGYDANIPMYFTDIMDYEVRVGSGTLTSYSCCVGIRGNIDGSADDAIDIGDLVYFVSYFFHGGPPPPCLDEGNVDGAAGIDISDLVYLADYMFQGGWPPLGCP